MEAPVIQRHPNFFTLLPNDVRNIIAAKLGGRTLTLLGGYSWLLNQYVKNAQEVWKRIYLESNLGADPTVKLNWREEYALQGLVKRNIRLGNCIEYRLEIPIERDNLFPGQMNELFCHGKVYVTTDREILCFDKKGKQQEIIPINTIARTTLDKVDEEILIVSEKLKLIVRTADRTVSLVDGTDIYTYDKQRIIYQRNDIVKSVWLYDFKQGSYTQLPDLFSCCGLTGIYNNLLFVKYLNRFVIYNIDTKEKENVLHTMYLFPQILVYPFIFFIIPSGISVYSCKDKTFQQIPSYGKITHDKSRLFLSEGSVIKKWDFEKKQFLPFAQAVSSHLLDGKQLLAASPTHLTSYNVDTGECNFCIKEESFFLDGCFVKNNLLFGINSTLSFTVFDLGERRAISISQRVANPCADKDSVLCRPEFPSSIDYRILKDFSQPLSRTKQV